MAAPPGAPSGRASWGVAGMLCGEPVLAAMLGSGLIPSACMARRARFWRSPCSCPAVHGAAGPLRGWTRVSG